MSGRIVMTTVFALLPVVAVNAQTCMGSAPFAERFLQGGVDMSSSASAQSVTTGLSAGAQDGPFASIAFGTAHDDKLADHAPMFVATTGFPWSLRAQPSVRLCPVLSVLTLRDVDLPNGRNLSSRSYGAGGSIGVALRLERGFALVPFAMAAISIQDATIHTQPFAPDFGQTLGIEDTFRTLSLGIGLVWSNAFTLRPSMSFATADGATTRSYALRVAISFGRLPRHTPVVHEGEGSLAGVWINPRTQLYYCADSKWYGNTAEGSFMSERDAIAAGYEPELGKLCGPKESGSVKPPGDQ